jgi:transglutaminase-like putative cysteine protease
MTHLETQREGTLYVNIGCDFVYQSAQATPMMMIVRPQDSPAQRLLEERRLVEPELPIDEYVDGFGNRVWRLVAPAGTLHVRYDAIAEVAAAPDPFLPDLPATPVERLPGEVLVYTLPSRHCQSDLFIDDAWRMFGDVPGGWQQVQAVCDWIHSNIVYGKGSTSNTSSDEVYRQRRGVCRDFAHLGVTLCRALNIPARYVCGYLPDIGVEPDPTPMDFHAWFEVYLDGAWRTFDARHNRPRYGRVLIGGGRDAVDLAFATIYGASRLTSMQVWADEATTTPARNSNRKERKEL